jgi:hypothetical protein
MVSANQLTEVVPKRVEHAPTPIFVVGAERSGTKWLANILCNHPAIVGVQSERHHGILETNMLANMERKFNLRSDDDYFAMLDLWFKTDFFQITQVDKHVFYRLQPRPNSCVLLFALLMDELARKKGTQFWIQKTNPEAALRVADFFHDARWIVIRRNIIDNIKSTLQDIRNRGGQMSVIRATYSYIVHEKQLKCVSRKVRPVDVSYEDLVRDTAGQIERVCEILGVKYYPSMLHVQFNNSSFSKTSDRTSALGAAEKTLIKCCSFIFRLFPLACFYLISRLKRLIRRNPPDVFIPGTFSLLRCQSLQEAESEDCNRVVVSRTEPSSPGHV